MRFSKGVISAALVVAACFAWLYHDVIRWLIDDWEGDYSHGYLIVPISLYLAWERRDRLRATPVRPDWRGLIALAACMGLMLAGTLAAETLTMRLSMIGAVVATIWFMFGAAHVRLLRFPLLFLLFMVPLPGIIYNRITFPLQLVASQFGESVLSAGGIPVLREGNLISLPHITLEVAEACSGIRSLVSLSMLTVLFGHLGEPRRGIRALLVAATIPVAILVNGFRVAATGVAAYYYGLEAAEGFFHSFSGWAMFGLAALILLALRGALGAVWQGQPIERQEFA